jgi:hypothetical protein
MVRIILIAFALMAVQEVYFHTLQVSHHTDSRHVLNFSAPPHHPNSTQHLEQRPFHKIMLNITIMVYVM